MPPQSPIDLEPTALLEVNTIALSTVPIAINFAFFVTIKEELEIDASPRITVPGLMVKVTPAFT